MFAMPEYYRENVNSVGIPRGPARLVLFADNNLKKVEKGSSEE
jgi:hypothetical protein